MQFKGLHPAFYCSFFKQPMSLLSGKKQLQKCGTVEV